MPVSRSQIYADRYLAGKTKRYHTWPMIKEQSVADHCHRVACLYVEIFGYPRPEVLYFCLNHDSGELWAGDPPFGLSNHYPEYRHIKNKAEEHGRQLLKIDLPVLFDEETLKVKVCDILEMYETGLYEMRLGNQYAEPIMKDTFALARDMMAKYGWSREFRLYTQGGNHGSE